MNNELWSVDVYRRIRLHALDQKREQGLINWMVRALVYYLLPVTAVSL